MKKYKHKKTGIIGELWDDGHVHFERGNGKVVCVEAIYKDFVIDTNDWEEVIEKEYEILSFKYTKEFFDKTDGILLRENKGTFWMSHISFKHNHYSEEELLNNKEVHIHSVKRLSDGEIFTVGDKVSVITHMGKRDEHLIGKNITIKSFHIFGIKDKLMCVDTDKGNLGFCTIGPNISTLVHYEEPLFKTEDGVEVFEGDDVIGVTNNFVMYPWLSVCKEGIEKTTTKYFATKEAAEHYIFRNKPCLSINDVKAVLKEGKSYQYHNTTMCALFKLVESWEKKKD